MKKAIIISANNVSIEVAKILSNNDYEVSIVDNDEQLCEKAYKILKSKALIYRGDPRSADVLNEVGIDKAEILLALSSNDDINYEACKIAKESGVPFVIAMVNDKSKEGLFKELNVEVISVEDIITSKIGDRVLSKFTEQLLTDPSSGLFFVKIRIRENSEVIGLKVGDLVSTYDVAIPYIVTSGGVIKPDNEHVIESNMELVVVGPRDHVENLIKRIIGEA